MVPVDKDERTVTPLQIHDQLLHLLLPDSQGQNDRDQQRRLREDFIVIRAVEREVEVEELNRIVAQLPGNDKMKGSFLK